MSAGRGWLESLCDDKKRASALGSHLFAAYSTLQRTREGEGERESFLVRSYAMAKTWRIGAALLTCTRMQIDLVLTSVRVEVVLRSLQTELTRHFQ